uniref:Ovule protein n=1 Tax=Ascaris lumbricoides TaxID=6252 RepID=A0A0M3IT98_ASCLU
MMTLNCLNSKKIFRGHLYVAIIHFSISLKQIINITYKLVSGLFGLFRINLHFTIAWTIVFRNVCRKTMTYFRSWHEEIVGSSWRFV